jgi:hypothetical protein
MNQELSTAGKCTVDNEIIFSWYKGAIEFRLNNIVG